MLSILSSCVTCQLSYLTHKVFFFFFSFFFFFFHVFFGEFQQENYVGMWEHYGSRVMGGTRH